MFHCVDVELIAWSVLSWMTIITDYEMNSRDYYKLSTTKPKCIESIQWIVFEFNQCVSVCVHQLRVENTKYMMGIQFM